MQFKKISLENYRQFKGQQELIFRTTEKGKNISVIIGENGEGKTNLLNSISWCLYGNEIKTTKYDELPIPTQINKNETSDSFEKVKVEIQFDLSDSDSKYNELIITREANIIDDDIDKPKLSAVLFQRDNPNPLPLSDPTVFIEQNIPEDLIDFFLFDGEQLETYFLSTVSDTVAKGIEKLSRIDILKQSIRKLKEIKKDYVKEVARNNPNLKNLLKLQTSIERDKENCENELIEKRISLAESESNKNKIDRDYENCKGQNINDLANQRQSLENTKKILLNNRSDLEKELTLLIQYDGPFYLCNTALKKVMELIDNKEEVGEFPPDIKDTFVEKLLNSESCICKQELKDGSTYRDEVIKLLNTLTKQEFIQIAQSKYKDILVQKTKYKNLPDNLMRLKKDISTINNKINYNTTLIENISEQLKDNPEEYVNALETQRKSLEKRISDLTKLIGRLEHQNEEFLLRENEITTKINNELAKQKKHEVSTKRRDLTNGAISLLEKVKNEIESETMQKVNEKMNDYFRKFHWKDLDTFEPISLEAKRGISIKKLGREALGSLSSGEQNFLALAFITAVREVSKFDLPVLIDTPFGRIGEKARENISKNLPNFLNSTQITILATPSEYTGAVKKELSPFINNVINLEYDKTSGITKIPNRGLEYE